MATPQTTYFGDLNVTGNTTLSGNLAVLGSFAYFASNLGAGSDGQSTIGPVANVYVGGSNTTTLNVTTISNGIGIGTSVSSGTALNVLGNAAVSNALQTTVVRVTTANAPGANVTSIYGPSGFVGLNTTGSSGTALYVLGNVNVASCVTTPNVFTTALNTTVLNTFSFWTTSNLAVGSAPVSSGPVLAVFGNVLVSNAIQIPNVLATTVNVIVANVTTIPGPLGVNGPALAHANLAVYGNVAISNGFTAPIVTFSGNGNVARILNVTSLVTGSNLGIGTGPVPGGPALHVIGNVVVSNTFTAPDTFTSSWNISGFANALTAVASKDFLVGGTTSGANVTVSGNVFVSNSIQTANIFSTFLNVATVNASSFMNPVTRVNIGTTFASFPFQSGYNDICGFFQAPTVTGTPTFVTAGGPAGLNSLQISGGSTWIDYLISPEQSFIEIRNIGITIAGWIKLNTFSTTNQQILFSFATTGATQYSTRLLIQPAGFFSRTFYGSSRDITYNTSIQTGIWYHVALVINAGGIDSYTRMYINGVNVGSTSLSVLPSQVTTQDLVFGARAGDFVNPVVDSIEFAGFSVLSGLAPSDMAVLYSAGGYEVLSNFQVFGNTFASNTLTTSSLVASKINVSARSNLFSLATSNVGIGTTPVASGATLVVQGNVAVSNALTTGTVFATSSNGTTLNTASIFGPSGNVGINTTTDFGTDLYVAGNLWASNALVMPNLSAPSINLTTANAISVVNWGMGIGTASIDTAQYFRGATQLIGDAPTSNTAILFPNTTGAIVNFGSATGGKVDYSTTNVFIEAWIYVPTGSAGGDILTYSNTSAGYSLEMKISSNQKLQFGILASPGGIRTTDENQFSAATWTHVAFAISQSAGQIACWKNGTQDAGPNTKSFSSPVYIATDSLVLGDTLNPSNSFDGYIRDVRIISGGVVPITGSFTPDQAPFTTAAPSYVTGGTTTFRLGILDPRTLIVQRNAFISNALTTTNLAATTANVTTAGIDFVLGPVGINTTGPSGTTLYVSGNLVASNALTALGAVNVITANVTTGLSLSAPLIAQNLGGTGNSLEVRGNAYVSNEVETTNLTALTSLNTTTLNVLSFSGRTGLNTTQASGTTLYTLGNVYASNALVTTNTFVSTFNVSRTTNTNTVELATATVQPNPDLVRYLRGAASIATDAPSYSGPALRLTGGSSSNPDSAVFGAGHPLNFDINTSNTFIEAFIYLSSTSGSYRTIFTIGDPSVSISSTNQPLLFCIQTYLSLFVKTQTSSAVVQGGGIIVGWWHVAAMIDVVNNTISVAYNGTLVTPTSITGGPIVTGPLNFSAAIGASQTSGTKYGFPGYISDLRIMRGGTVPSASFTAPTAPGTFSTAAPSYFAGGLTVFTLSDYMTPRLGATLTVGGNVIASNAVTSTNLNTISTTNVSVLANASVVSSVSAAIVRGSYANVALGTAANMVVSNGLTVSNIFGTRINAATLNTSSLFGNVGINTTAASGTTLYIQGNLSMSNVTTAVPNVYGTTSVNASTQVNTASIFGPSGFVGINTTGASGTTLYVQGNLYMSNVTTAVPNVYGTTSVNASTRVNTASIFGPSGNVSFGIQGDFSTTLYVQGNLYASNALGTSELDAITANITTTNVSSIFSPNSNVGIGTNDPSGTRLYVQGNLYASNALSTPTILTPTANATTVANVLEIDVGIGVGTSTTSGTNLYVLGNLYASNTLAAPSLRVTAGNVTTTNVSSIVGLSGKVGVNTTAPSGTDLYVGGNLYASNTLAAPNLRVTTGNVTTTNVSAILGPSRFVGISTTAPSGTTLYVNGNIFISNALSTPNVFTTNINASSTFNATTLVTQYVNAAALGWSNTNIFVANSITTTNVFATNVNASGYWSTSGFVGVNTTDASGTTLYVAGNVVASNALSAPDVLGGPWIYYNEDVTKRYPHLLPTPSNAASIQNWISTTCNATSQPSESWWSMSQTPVYSNATYSNSAYYGSVLIPDGRIVFVPSTGPKVGIYNPYTNEFSQITPIGLSSATSTKYRGGVLCPNGNVAFIPYAISNIGLFNPVDYTFSNVITGATSTTAFQGGVLSPQGNVIAVPRGSANIGVFSPSTGVFSNVGPIQGAGVTGFCGGVLLPSGNIVFAPLSAANIGMYNPSIMSASGFSNIGPVKPTGTGTSFEGGACLAPDGNVVFTPYGSSNAIVFNPTTFALTNISVTTAGGSKFTGSTLLPSGNILCCPQSSDNIGIIDPFTMVYSNYAYVGPAGPFAGCTIIPDGRVILCPSSTSATNVGVLDTMTPVPLELCLSPYFNKF